MSASRWLEEARKADPMPRANSANSAKSPEIGVLALTALLADGTETQNRRCVICNSGLDDAFFIATWMGADICPSGPCLQRALNQAVDDYTTPEAVARYAKELADE